MSYAVVGDSPLVYVDASHGWAHAPLHNARTNLPERQAALLRGAVYEGGYLMDPQHSTFGLQMARALGDADLAQVISTTPDCQTVGLDRQSLVIVASDGLIAPLISLERQMAQWVSRIQQGATAEDLVADALAAGSKDNVTAVVWTA